MSDEDDNLRKAAENGDAIPGRKVIYIPLISLILFLGSIPFTPVSYPFWITTACVAALATPLYWYGLARKNYVLLFLWLMVSNLSNSKIGRVYHRELEGVAYWMASLQFLCIFIFVLSSLVYLTRHRLIAVAKRYSWPDWTGK